MILGIFVLPLHAFELFTSLGEALGILEKKELQINQTYVLKEPEKEPSAALPRNEVFAARLSNCSEKVLNLICSTQECGATNYIDEIYWIIYSAIVTSFLLISTILICREKSKNLTLTAELMFSNPEFFEKTSKKKTSDQADQASLEQVEAE